MMKTGFRIEIKSEWPGKLPNSVALKILKTIQEAFREAAKLVNPDIKRKDVPELIFSGFSEGSVEMEWVCEDERELGGKAINLIEKAVENISNFNVDMSTEQFEVLSRMVKFRNMNFDEIVWKFDYTHRKIITRRDEFRKFARYLSDVQKPESRKMVIFGILRKELTLLMLFQALGTQQIQSILSSSQIIVFTTFIIFYTPCVATIAVMGKELGWKKTLFVSVLTFIIATFIALVVRILFLVY